MTPSLKTARLQHQNSSLVSHVSRRKTIWERSQRNKAEWMLYSGEWWHSRALPSRDSRQPRSSLWDSMGTTKRGVEVTTKAKDKEGQSTWLELMHRRRSRFVTRKRNGRKLRENSKLREHTRRVLRTLTPASYPKTSIKESLTLRLSWRWKGSTTMTSSSPTSQTWWVFTRHLLSTTIDSKTIKTMHII